MHPAQTDATTGAAQGINAHLSLFAAALRAHGIRSGLSDEIDAAAALALADLLDRGEVHRALRIAFKVPHEAWAIFDRLFDEHWGGAAVREVPVAPPAFPRDPRGRLQWRWDGERVRLEAQEPELPSGDEPGYSAEALLRRKPFDRILASEVAELERLLERLAYRLATRKSRRLVPARAPGMVDLRRCFRNALGTEGEILRLARRARALEQPRLVLLYDTSGSMDSYTRFHLAFAFALRRVMPKTEIFTFNTALARVTRAMASLNSAQSLERLAAEIPDWSGGTRIGSCLAEFVTLHGALIHRDTTVVILSDGLDLGDTGLLERSMRVLRERSRRIIWLNPLLGDARYEPAAAGMVAALPHVDHFGPAHNLEALEELVRFVGC